jgi:hypothetical protein
MQSAVPDKKTNFVFRQITSLLVTFYMSYLFVHFVVLNTFTLDDTLVIMVNVWLGHVVLNILTLMKCKNRTLGDLLVGLKYQTVKNNSGSATLLALRSVFSTTLFYLVVYCHYLLGFPLYAVIITVIAACLLIGCRAQMSGKSLSAVDWLTGTVAIKS